MDYIELEQWDLRSKIWSSIRGFVGTSSLSQLSLLCVRITFWRHRRVLIGIRYSNRYVRWTSTG